ncbi:MAG TPA: sigma-70 family RNA polymerase sigma factor [Kofleriaceae bacterium]|nr:sigma-70 family RNA polymerase sigma factor [Kofleriaceae bacterium]
MDDDPVEIAASKKPSVAAVVRPAKRAQSAADLDDDAALVEACRRGERRAMEALYHRYKRRVFGLVTRIVGPGDSEEVAQEVFVRIFRGLGRFRGDSQLSTWIYRLAVNASLSHVTRRPRHEGGDEEALANLPAPQTSGADPTVSHRLERALSSLPAGYRAVLVLHDIHGMNHDEVAEILGCHVGTSKSQLHKARARMRDLLGPALAAERAAQRGESGQDVEE